MIVKIKVRINKKIKIRNLQRKILKDITSNLYTSTEMSAKYYLENGVYLTAVMNDPTIIRFLPYSIINHHICREVLVRNGSIAILIKI